MTQYLDLHVLAEYKRIDMIGHRAVDHKERVAFIVEDDAKADRYMAKLKAKFPTLGEVERLPGPAGTVVVKVEVLQ